MITQEEQTKREIEHEEKINIIWIEENILRDQKTRYYYELFESINKNCKESSKILIQNTHFFDSNRLQNIQLKKSEIKLLGADYRIDKSQKKLSYFKSNKDSLQLNSFNYIDFSINNTKKDENNDKEKEKSMNQNKEDNIILSNPSKENTDKLDDNESNNSFPITLSNLPKKFSSVLRRKIIKKKYK